MAVTDTTRKHTFFTPARLVTFWLVALAIYFLTPLYKAVAWFTLGVPTLNSQVESHMRGVHGDAEYACLYTISCETGAPRLELQTILTSEKLARIKDTIWRRRFEDYCPGPVTNIGLEHNSSGIFTPRDCYSVGNDFGGATGFAAPCAFHELSRDTPCTRDLAYWTREHGIVAGR